MLTSIVTAAVVGIGTFICIAILRFLFIMHPMIRCVIESVLTAIILLLLAVNIVLGAEDTCNYITLGGVSIFSCIYLVVDWKDYKDLKSWFLSDEKHE